MVMQYMHTKINKEYMISALWVVSCVILIFSTADSLKSQPLFDTFSPYSDNLIKGKGKDTVKPFIPPIIREEDGYVSSITTDMPEDEDFRSNLDAPTLFKMDNYYFECDSIIPGVTRSARWSLEVINKFKDARADIRFADFDKNDSNIVIEYFAPRFIIEPLNHFFADIVTKDTVRTEFVITNVSQNSAILLDKVSLKYGNRGFTIIDDYFKPGYWHGNNVIMQPNDKIIVIVQFDATQEGLFEDSLGFGTKYVFSYISKIGANVLSPVIVCDDVDFFNVSVGDTVESRVNIYNKGKVDLSLNSFNSTRSPFRTDLYIEPGHPDTLKPGFQRSFRIWFTPDSIKNYTDSVVFFSNATGKDHITRISGRGVKPGLIVTSADWGRVRINRPDRPELAEVPAYEQEIFLKNTLDDTLTVYNIELIDSSKGYAFEFDTSLVNLKLGPKDSETSRKRIPIGFHPRETGYHELRINYITSTGDKIQSVLKGIGKAPKISTSNVEFDSSIVEDFFTPVSKKIVFKNENWEYGDLLQIFKLNILPDGNEIADDVSEYSKTWGTQGFKIIEKNKPDLPLILNPGDSLVYMINYVAQREGPTYAAIQSFSDALEDKKAELTGIGIFCGIIPVNSETSSCVGDSNIVISDFVHYGKLEIDVDSIRIYGSDAFTLKQPELADSAHFILGETKHLELYFAPEKPDTVEAEIVAYYKIKENPKEAKAILKGMSYHTDRNITTILKNDDNNPEIGDSLKILELGDKLKGSVYLDIGDDISFYKIRKFFVKIEFNPNFLMIDERDIINGSLLFSKFNRRKIDTLDNKKGVVIFSFTQISEGYLSGYGELFSFAFRTIQPKLPDSVYRSAISIYVSPNDNHCVEFINTNTKYIELNKYLTPNLQWKDFSPDENLLLEIRPNPAYINNPSLDFEIKSEGFYKLEVNNILGQTVEPIFAMNLKPGNYIATIPTGNLSSGVYWVTLISEKFSNSKKFIYVK